MKWVLFVNRQEAISWKERCRGEWYDKTLAPEVRKEIRGRREVQGEFGRSSAESVITNFV